MSRRVVSEKQKQGRPAGRSNEACIGPWKLTKSEALVLDCYIVFGTHIGVSQHLTLATSTVNNHLARIVKRMTLAGEKFEGTSRGKRNQSIVIWLRYWWSDEGKANLRNALLTGMPQP